MEGSGGRKGGTPCSWGTLYSQLLAEYSGSQLTPPSVRGQAGHLTGSESTGSESSPCVNSGLASSRIEPRLKPSGVYIPRSQTSAACPCEMGGEKATPESPRVRGVGAGGYMSADTSCPAKMPHGVGIWLRGGICGRRLQPLDPCHSGLAVLQQWPSGLSWAQAGWGLTGAASAVPPG